MSRTAFADGDGAFTGGWSQEYFDNEFEKITQHRGLIGYVGFSAVNSPARKEAKLRHPSNHQRLPDGALPQVEFLSEDTFDN